MTYSLIKSIARMTSDFSFKSKEPALESSNKNTQALSILVVGGGPVGLAYATSMKAVMGAQVEISVHDGRWKQDNDIVVWKGSEESVNRREQVVTLQSGVIARLPEVVQTAIFPVGGYTEVWPTGGESPAYLGHPRNVPLRVMEDRFLPLAQSQGIHLVPGKISAETLETEMTKYDLIVIADGPRSRIRDHFIGQFGSADKAPYSLNDEHIEDVVLGLRVTTTMPDPDQVVMTIAQQRFLMNVSEGSGYLYMRLTAEEAKEVRGHDPDGSAYVDCIQSNPCLMHVEGIERFACLTHKTRFAPAEDATSYLWPRVQGVMPESW